MPARLVVVTGTGTGIGKTHMAAALVGAWASLAGEGARIGGVKPVESGVARGAELGDDGAALAAFSTFHVKQFPPPYLLGRAVSPHLAARDEGRTVDAATIVRWLDGVRAAADGVVLELAGGLFSPLADGLSNADLATALAPDALLLVAPDRLGVLHDVTAAVRAARPLGLDLTGVVLVAPETADASTGTNAAELARFAGVRVLATVPRAPVATLAGGPALAAVARAIAPAT